MLCCAVFLFVIYQVLSVEHDVPGVPVVRATVPGIWLHPAVRDRVLYRKVWPILPRPWTSANCGTLWLLVQVSLCVRLVAFATVVLVCLCACLCVCLPCRCRAT